MARRLKSGWTVFPVIFVLSSILFAWGNGDQTGPFEVYLKRSCAVSGGRLTLADIVQRSFGGSDAPDFSSVTLPYTAGRLMIFPPPAARASLKQRYAGPLILVGQSVFVLPGDLIPDGNRWFYEQLLEFIKGQIPSSRVEVEFDGYPELPAEWVDGLAFSIGSTALRNGLKSGPARIAFRGNGPRADFSGSVGVILHAFAPVAVPKAAIQAGERFGDDALASRDVDLSLYGEDLLFYDRAGGDFTARTHLAAGEPIALRKISRILFVRSGDRVAITFVRKNITVGLRGRALSSGSYDGIVKVKPDQSERRFEARVTGHKEVLVELH